MKYRLTSTLIFTVVMASAYAQLTSASYQASKDAYVYERNPTSNFGGLTSLRAGMYPVSTVQSPCRTMLYFNFSIPANAIITRAELKIKGTIAAVGLPIFQLGRLNASWNETGTGAITWMNQPSNDMSDAVFFAGNSGGLLTINVKSHVQKMVAGVYPNHGWIIAVNPEETGTNKYQNFHSREASLSTNRPVLEVDYYIPMSIAAATIKHVGSTETPDGAIYPMVTNGPGGTYTYKWYNSSSDEIGNSLNLIGVEPGWYGLEVTSSVAGSQPFYYSFLVGRSCSSIPIEYNPGSNYIDDAMLHNKTANLVTNYGTYTAIEAYENEDYGSDYDARMSLLRFRLWVDPGLEVQAADLALRGQNQNNSTYLTNNAAFHNITSDWQENIVTFSSIPPYTTSPVAFDCPVNAVSNQFRTLDIVPAIENLQSNPTSNYGWLFRLDSYGLDSRRHIYCSSDHGTPSYRPTINFQIAVFDSNCLPYNELKRSLDGGYAIALDGMIKFTMDEEYAVKSNKYLSITIYDQSHQVLERSDSDGNVQNASITPLDLKFDDNRWTLDISGIPGISAGSFYTIEVTTSKGDKRYLRFLYKN